MDYNKLYILTFQLTTSQGGRQEHTIFHHGPEVFQLTTSQGGRPDIPEIRTVITNFNSRPRKEVDAFLSWLAELLANHFNSRPRKEVDEIAAPVCDKSYFISTHDLARRSTTFPSCTGMVRTFQLTTSQGGRHSSPMHRQCCVNYFNSRPRKEVDQTTDTIQNAECISTHDLARRSTVRKVIFIDYWSISTHDLARRSTRLRSNYNQTTAISTHDLARRST